MPSETIHVSWHPQYRGSPTGGIVTGYRVYAWIGHKLLGVVRGTEHTVRTEAQAKKLAKQMREQFRRAGNTVARS